MSGIPNADFLHKLERRRDGIVATGETMIMEARAAGREYLTEGETQRLAHMKDDIAGLNDRIAEYRADLERSAIPAHLSRLSPTTSRNTMNHADARDLTYRRGDQQQSWCRD